mgnify:FL=1|tara:strand:+ start:59 stop:535 length:477 start_codon:yes stop_codon:yes gene_type:complete
MLIEYNKFTVLVYFITGTTLTFSGRRWIYGLSIIFTSAAILLHNYFMHHPELIKYSQITLLVSLFIFFCLLGTSLFILNKSTADINHKIFSISFLFLALLYSILKKTYQSEPIFNTVITRYISTLMIMIFLWSVGYIADNQAILQTKVNEYRDKLKRF